MSLDEYVPVLIFFMNEVQNSSDYPALQQGLQRFSPSKEPPSYASYGVSTIATARLHQDLIDILRGHTLIKRIYNTRVPLRDYSMINTRLHPLLQNWDDQLREMERKLE